VILQREVWGTQARGRGEDGEPLTKRLLDRKRKKEWRSYTLNRRTFLTVTSEGQEGCRNLDCRGNTLIAIMSSKKRELKPDRFVWDTLNNNTEGSSQKNLVRREKS